MGAVAASTAVVPMADGAYGDGLLAVGEIAVRGYFDAVLHKRLEDNEVGVLGDRRGVEGEGHVCVSVVILGSELKLGGDFFLIRRGTALRWLCP